MAARYWDMPPSGGRAAPPPEFADETVFDWIRRQNRPVKPVPPRTRGTQTAPAPTPAREPKPTAFQAAVLELAQKKKDVEAVAPAESRRPSIPEGN